MNTSLSQNLSAKKTHKWYLSIPIAVGLFALLYGSSLYILVQPSQSSVSGLAHSQERTTTSVRTHQGSVSELAYSLDGDASASAGLTNQRIEPSTFDTRPCEMQPSAQNCDGLYPVTPPQISWEDGSSNGSGACIDGASKIVEDQNLTDEAGNIVGDLQLRWMPTCLSYYGYVSFIFPLSQVSTLSIQIQTETYTWYQWFSQLPPFPNQTEQSGPLQGNALIDQELYSPLIYSPSDPVSTTIDLTLTDGSHYENITSSYSAGIKQYTI